MDLIFRPGASTESIAGGAEEPARRHAEPVDVARVAAAMALARAGRQAPLEAALSELLGQAVRLVQFAPASAPGHDRAIVLSARLQAVAELIVDGRTDKEIAAVLGVSHATARTYVRRLCQKLDVSGRGGVLRWALGERLSARRARAHGRQ